MLRLAENLRKGCQLQRRFDGAKEAEIKELLPPAACQRLVRLRV
ncbi:hypothetical protein ACNKHO_25595 [Shigella flexneri]